MPKPTKGPRLGSGPSHQKLLLSGLAAALFREERIRTTEAKAKRLRPVAERLITLGKAGTVHARRQALRLIEDRDVVHKLFADIAPRYTDREGGYTRILRLGPRHGDSALMAIVELTEGESGTTTGGEAAAAAQEPSRRRGVLGRRRPRGGATKTRPSAEEAVEPTEAVQEEVEAPEGPEITGEGSEAPPEHEPDDAPDKSG